MTVRVLVCSLIFWVPGVGMSGLAAAGEAVASPPPTPVPPAVDLANAAIPSLCDFPPVRLVDGSFAFAALPTGGFEMIELVEQAEGDLDGDGVAEVAGVFHCNWGGTAVESVAVVFRQDLTPIGAMAIGQVPDPGYETTDGWISEVAWQPGSFRVDTEFEVVPGSDYRSMSVWLTVIGGALYMVHGDAAPVLLPAPAAVGDLQGDGGGSEDDGNEVHPAFLDDLPTWQDADADEAAGLPVAWITDQFDGEGFRLRCQDVVEYFPGDPTCEGEPLDYFRFLTEEFPDGFGTYVQMISAADLSVTIGGEKSALIQRPVLISHLGFVACYTQARLGTSFPGFQQYLDANAITFVAPAGVDGLATVWNTAVGPRFCHAAS